MLVDSSVWIDYFNGVESPATEVLDKSLGYEYIVVGDLVLTEVLQGFRRDRDYRMARDLLTEFELRTLLGPEQAMRVADNYRRLRKRGVTVRKTVDLMIASYCIQHGQPLLASDRDFLPIAGHLGLKLVIQAH